MGKWTALKGKLVKFAEPESWQSKIDKVKQADYAGKTKHQLCAEFVRIQLEKDRLKEQLEKINVCEAALDQLMVDVLESESELSTKNEFGTFFIKDDPYSSIVDRQKYLTWIAEQGLEELLTVNYQTTSGLVKARLEEGKEPPPGINVYMKSSIGFRRS